MGDDARGTFSPEGTPRITTLSASASGPSLQTWRPGAAVPRRQQRAAAPRGSVYYPFTTRPRKGACTVDSTRNRWKAIPRIYSCRGERILNLRPFGPETAWAPSHRVLILRKLVKPLQAGRAPESSHPRVSQRMREILLPIYYPTPGPGLARRARAWARQATRCPGGATSRPEPRHAYGQRPQRLTWSLTGAGGTGYFG